CGIQITTPEGIQVSSVQIAGWVARRILTYVKPGETVVAGQRYGFIRFGSRVDIYVPEDAKIVAKLGKWVLAGSDTIAQLTSREASVDSV
ncbi:MAG: phosphatidylserine decarboxylase, partial [Arenicellales bacterium]|nr:phosphatidylserine decarboxylase [Arenicellales bacterium]